MSDVFNNLSQLFSSNNYQPHGYCLFWNQPLLLNYVVSGSLIAVSYFSIPFGLVYFIRQRKDLAFRWVFVMFAVFIVGCGATHVIDIVTLWTPAYWLGAGVRHVTAIASVATAVALWLMLPKAIRLPSPAQLTLANLELQAQIAERERVEQELRRVNEMLETRTAELEALNKELELFSYSVSHDLRAPLRGIAGFSKVLQEDYSSQLDAAGQGYLNRITTAADRMGNLIDSLLELSRLSRSEPKQQEVDLTQLARTVLRDLQEREPQREVEVTVKENALASGDPQLLMIVLENLLGNAWKYTRKQERASIVFGFTTFEGEATYYVQDNGAGFDMSFSSKLFGVFQRLHTHQEFEGIGIGLATVQRIIHRHGGRIWAEGEVDKGATFYFTLGTSPEDS